MLSPKSCIISQVTTHSHLLSSDEVDELSDILQPTVTPDVFSFLLQEFDTELDFTSKVRWAYQYAQNMPDICRLVF